MFDKSIILETQSGQRQISERRESNTQSHTEGMYFKYQGLHLMSISFFSDVMS
eukprot:UN19319